MKKRNNSLSKKLLKEGDERCRLKFNELVRKGKFKPDEFDRFIICIVLQ